MRTAPLLDWLASLPPERRDAAVEAHLALGTADPSPPGENLLGYHPAGVAPIVRALLEVPVTEADTLIDLGSGLGKVVLLARMLTGATARGVEIQPGLAERARAAAARLDVDARFTCGDARDADLGDGTVFFLYAPFAGPVIAEVMTRLHAVARRRAIVVCALGLDLDRSAPWLVPRDIDAFWLEIYDSGEAGVPRRPRTPAGTEPNAEAVAFERVAPEPARRPPNARTIPPR